MFSMFPDGWPGAGLLLLRVATGTVLIAQSFAYLDKRGMGFSGVAMAAAAAVVAISLLIGFLTRFVALAAATIGIVSVFASVPASAAGPLVTPATVGLCTVIAVSVICLGPGALSLDARLFGRREIVIPPSSPRE